MKTKLKNLTKIAVFASMLGAFCACNSSDEISYTLPSSATVRSFSLEANDSILNNLDSVFFSIDLYNREIFNADSLPFGTKVSAVTPVIVTESASTVELIYTNSAGEEVTLDYLENTTDTVNLSQPAKLRVVSYDRSNESIYTVRVNVHQVPTDTLVWSRVEKGSLPTVFSAVNAQHTTMSPDGTFYCLTSYQNEYSLAVTTDPSGTWDTSKLTLSFTPDINSLTATTSGLYILDTAGAMYESTDNGSSWVKTSTSADYLIGAYGSRLLGTVKSGSQWNIFEYPAGTVTPAPTGFPVLNTSNAVSVTFEMSTSPQMIITGGKTADGTLTADSWSFDGKSWANISRRPIGAKLENLTITPYFDLVPDTVSWKVSQRTSVLMAFCGNNATGEPNTTAYISHDFGMTWDAAPQSMQIPVSVVPARTRAQAFPYTATQYASRTTNPTAISWSDTGYGRSFSSRATAPITEWGVPYIYLFGGVNSAGAVYNTVYRGVITQFTQKPLQ